MTHLTHIALLSIAMLAGCAERDAPRSEPDAAQVDRTTPTRSAGMPAGAPSTSLTTLTFDTTAIPSGCEYVGTILGGRRWRDANGENVLIVSQRFAESREEPSMYRQEIFGYCYIVERGAARLLWKIQDFAENFCDRGKGLVSEIRIADLDGDGIMENAFVYNVDGKCDVSPSTYKLMMHSGAAKHAIRGSDSVCCNTDEQPLFADPTTIDFKGAPAIHREWAVKLWHETMAYRRTKEL